MPLYPFLAILAAMPVYLILEYLRNYRSDFVRDLSPKYNFTTLVKQLIIAVIFVLIFYHPCRINLEKSIYLKETEWEEGYYRLSAFLKKNMSDNTVNLKDYTILTNGYNAHLQFYIAMLAERDIHLGGISKPDDLRPGNYITSHEEIVPQLIADYNLDIDTLSDIFLIQIIEQK